MRDHQRCRRLPRALIAFDPDLWILAVEDRQGRHFSTTGRPRFDVD
jgi:hypothetical protein